MYNVAPWLHDCVDSLLAQTYENIELIFVDDKSTDNSLEILRDYEKLHADKIRVIASPENRFQGGARNLGLKAAKGEYIGFCDSDDMVHPTMYEKLYEKIVATGSQAAECQRMCVPEEAIYQDIIRQKHQATFSWKKELTDWDGKDMNHQAVSDMLAYSIGLLTILAHRQQLLEPGVWFPEKRKFEDNYWGAIVFAYLRRVAYVFEPLYYYRQRSSSTTHTISSSSARDRMVIEPAMLAEARRRGLLGQFHAAYEWIYIFRYARNTSYALYRIEGDKSFADIKYMAEDLERNFPQWKRNKYFMESANWLARMKLQIFLKHPGIGQFLFFGLWLQRNHPSFFRRISKLKHRLQGRMYISAG